MTYEAPGAEVEIFLKTTVFFLYMESNIKSTKSSCL